MTRTLANEPLGAIIDLGIVHLKIWDAQVFTTNVANNIGFLRSRVETSGPETLEWSNALVGVDVVSEQIYIVEMRQFSATVDNRTNCWLVGRCRYSFFVVFTFIFHLFMVKCDVFLCSSLVFDANSSLLCLGGR